MGDDATFATPGRADDLDDAVLARWNQEVRASYEPLAPTHGSRFFALDPGRVAEATNAPVQWFADPAEPRFCLGAEAARRLSDWGVRGRHARRPPAFWSADRTRIGRDLRTRTHPVPAPAGRCQRRARPTSRPRR